MAGVKVLINVKVSIFDETSDFNEVRHYKVEAKGFEVEAKADARSIKWHVLMTPVICQGSWSKWQKMTDSQYYWIESNHV